MQHLNYISMYKFIVNILLVTCFALPSWGKFAGLAYVGEIEWNKYNKTAVKLLCDINDNDTVWTLEMQGAVEHYDTLLIKTGDSKVLELAPFDEKFDHVTDSLGHSPLTGELIEYYHYEAVIYYHITTTALNYIAEHGIAKLRYGHDSFHRDIVYKKNEFGTELTRAYKKILTEISPEYVPPKKPSVRDGF